MMVVSLGYCFFAWRQRRGFGRQRSIVSENAEAAATAVAIPLTRSSQLEHLERSMQIHDIEQDDAALGADETLPEYQDRRPRVAELEAPPDTQHPLNRLDPRNSKQQ
jgi:hypothetical protein